MSRLAAFVLMVLASCTPMPKTPETARAVPLDVSLAPIKTFAAKPVRTPTRSNAEIAQDFIDLTFRLESGREIPFMTRFEGPISVGVTGDVSDILVADLDQLLSRLRTEASIDITRTSSQTPDIIVEAIPRDVLSKTVPRAACFVVPRIASWDEFLQKRGTNALDWTTLRNRNRATMFVPADVAPQEIRDCLHEELAQALGPLNDLYRLPDSVFNDDNIHNVLTSFDMLILKTYYAADLRNGMSRTEVAARLPALLNRLNPAGRNSPMRGADLTNRNWITSVQTALSSDVSPTRRRAAAQQAVTLSDAMGWSGPRTAFALYAQGRLLVGHDSDAALRAFQRADRIYRENPATAIHAAHIAVQRAAFTFAAGDTQATIEIADEAIPSARSHQNAALLATLMMFKAEALALQGDDAAAAAVHLDSLGWARYGFGQDIVVQARLNEIRALRPL